MGAWGITERESDAGLDQLDLITVELLEPNGFEVFHVADAMALLRKNILAQIELANRGCSPEALKSYIEESYPCEFTHAALLLAECIGDYYRSGGLIVNEYIRESNQLKERAVKKIVISSDDLQVLLEELQRVQSPKHEIYQSWSDEETRQKWLTHIQSVQQTLKEYA